MNTSFSYMYRDAGNWKQHATVVLKGEISEADIVIILAKRQEGEFFLPTQVGLEALQNRFEALGEDDDHIWHEFSGDDIELTDKEPTIDLTAEQLVANFKSVDKWDVLTTFNQLWGTWY